MMKAWIFPSLAVAAGGFLPRAIADEQTVHCRQGVVVSVNGLASDVGLAIQKQAATPSIVRWRRRWPWP